MRIPLPLAVIAAALFAAPAALADSSTSSNWAGYAIHRSGVEFHKAFALWTQPRLSCTPGHRGYSAYWVGIGGYSTDASALEQIGTEADCGVSGHARMGAWYELVPAPSRGLKLSVHTGDLIGGTVTVAGHEVTLTLTDHTTGHSATKRVRARSVDISSAEWIAEAPSECNSATSCKTLPLADFGSTTFRFAGVQTENGYTSGISSRRWNVSKITLVTQASHRVGYHGLEQSERAIPSALSAKGSQFTVTYATGAAGDNESHFSGDLRSR